jgi:hypothetical protein
MNTEMLHFIEGFFYVRNIFFFDYTFASLCQNYSAQNI